jgi:hypothetical protein
MSYPKITINDSKLFASFYYPNITNDTCTICRVSLQGDSIYHEENKNYSGNTEKKNIIFIGNCGHAFHDICMNKWKTNNIKCPVCSEKFVSVKTLYV